MASMMPTVGPLETETLHGDVRREGERLERMGQRCGRYMLLRRLGQGGGGTVYDAYDPDLDRRVAIKLITPPHPQATDVILEEARALGAISHPQVVRVIDVFVHEGVVALVMERAHGLPGHDWAQKHPTRRSLLRVARQLVEAVAALHACNIVHRDIKPSNFVIDPQERLVLLDLGLARALRPNSSDEPGGVGTRGYRAPEMERTHLPSLRADVFGLSTTLKTLFSLANRRMPRWLARPVEQGCAPDPNDRLPDTSALHRAFETWQRRPYRLLFGLTALTIMTVVVIWHRTHRPPDRCNDPLPTAELVRAQTKLRGALTHTSENYVREQLQWTLDGLASAQQELSAGYARVCEAVPHDPWQSSPHERASWQCLEEARVTLQEIAAQLVHEDATGSVQAVFYEIPRATTCLQHPRPIAGTPERARALGALEADLARLRAVTNPEELEAKWKGLHERAQKIDAPSVLAKLYLLKVIAAHNERRNEDAFAASKSVLRFGVEALDQRLMAMGAQSAWRACVYGEHDDCSAWRWLAEQTTQADGSQFTRMNLAVIALDVHERTGDREGAAQAMAEADLAYQHAKTEGGPLPPWTETALLQAKVGQVLANRDFDAAIATADAFEKHMRLAKGPGHLGVQLPYQWRAIAKLERGELESALDELRVLYRYLGEKPVPRAFVESWHLLAVDVFVRKGCKQAVQAILVILPREMVDSHLEAHREELSRAPTTTAGGQRCDAAWGLDIVQAIERTENGASMISSE